MRIILSLIALCGTASAAVAASPGEASFLGPRLDMMVGYDATELPNDDGPEVMAGLRVGQDFRIGDWRIGIEGDVSRSNANRIETDVFESGDRIHVRYGTDLYLGVRPGRTLSQRVLAYGLAGGAATKMSVAYSGNLDAIEHVPGGPQPAKFRRPGRLIGFWVGGGLELSLSRKNYLRTEYRYSNFHDGLYRHQGVFALGLRF